MHYWQWEDKISQQITKRGTIFRRENSVLLKFLDIMNGFTEKKDTVHRKISSPFVNTLIFCTNLSFLAWSMFMENVKFSFSPLEFISRKEIIKM